MLPRGITPRTTRVGLTTTLVLALYTTQSNTLIRKAKLFQRGQKKTVRLQYPVNLCLNPT
jgi:hypothetical protein